MRTQAQVLERFVRWARGNELVRAAVLTSSRADPKCAVDVLSDYDIEFFVSELEPFVQSDDWLDHFGEVMVRWPFRPRPGASWSDLTRLVIYSDRVRMDFQIHQITRKAADAFDGGYQVLLDKDGLLSHLEPPAQSKYLVKKPSAEQYQTLVNHFWWNAHYVPKYLKRDQLPYAAAMLGQSIRVEHLHPVMQWFIGMQHDWQVNTGVYGCRFKQYLDNQTWVEYESTFAGPGLEEQWGAFLNSVRLFMRLAKSVGDRLGYEYPQIAEQKMIDYFYWIWSTGLDEAGRSPQ